MTKQPVDLHHDDAIYTLGETGLTVIYIFPEGDALMERDAIAASATLENAQAQKEQEVENKVEFLLAQGLITSAQLSVAHHDQATTGLSILEALAARGWIAEDLLASLDTQAIA